MKFWHLLIHRLDSDFFTHAIRACRTSADFLVPSETWRAAARNWDVPMAAVGAHSLIATSREVWPGRMAEVHANISALPRGDICGAASIFGEDQCSAHLVCNSQDTFDRVGTSAAVAAQRRVYFGHSVQPRCRGTLRACLAPRNSANLAAD